MIEVVFVKARVLVKRETLSVLFLNLAVRHVQSFTAQWTKFIVVSVVI